MSKYSFLWLLLLVLTLFLGQSCSSAGPNGNVANVAPTAGNTETVAEQPPAEIDPTVLDRLRTEKWTGDIDGMVERRYIRALVLYSKTGFFFDGPQPRGVSYEGAQGV